MNFIEPRITFKPTYKYNPNSDEFDTEKCRIPSYCVRSYCFIVILKFLSNEILGSNFIPHQAKKYYLLYSL